MPNPVNKDASGWTRQLSQTRSNNINNNLLNFSKSRSIIPHNFYNPRYNIKTQNEIPTRNNIISEGFSINSPYDWMLIDNTNEIWIADSDFTNLRRTNNLIPLGSDYWGYGNPNYERCIWTGKYWLFGNKKTNKLMRSPGNLSSWAETIDIVTPVSGSNYTIVTDGNNKTIIASNTANSYISNNNGETWISKGIILNNDKTFFLRTYYDNSTWIISTDRSLHISTNDGASFTDVTDNIGLVSNDQILDICKRTTDNKFILIGRNKIWESSNGSTWTSSNITGVTQNLIGEILHNGTYFVGVGAYNGPMWSTNGISWNNWSSNDGSTFNSVDYDYRRLHYNGTRYAFRNGIDNKLYTSTDGKIWAYFSHPLQSRWFIDAYPKIQDGNLNLK